MRNIQPQILYNRHIFTFQCWCQGSRPNQQRPVLQFNAQGEIKPSCDGGDIVVMPPKLLLEVSGEEYSVEMRKLSPREIVMAFKRGEKEHVLKMTKKQSEALDITVEFDRKKVELYSGERSTMLSYAPNSREEPNHKYSARYTSQVSGDNLQSQQDIRVQYPHNNRMKKLHVSLESKERNAVLTVIADVFGTKEEKLEISASLTRIDEDYVVIETFAVDRVSIE